MLGRDLLAYMVLMLKKLNVRLGHVPKKEVRSFWGLSGYYRDYIPHYAAVTVPLTDLTKKGKPDVVEWGLAQDNAFRSLKSSLTSAPILKLPDVDMPFVLRCDASSVGLGAVLLQYHDQALFPVSYASKKVDRHRKTIFDN